MGLSTGNLLGLLYCCTFSSLDRPLILSWTGLWDFTTPLSATTLTHSTESNNEPETTKKSKLDEDPPDT